MTQFLTVTMGFWLYLVGWSVAAAAAAAPAAAAATTTTSGVTRTSEVRPLPMFFLWRTGLESKMQCSGIANT